MIRWSDEVVGQKVLGLGLALPRMTRVNKRYMIVEIRYVEDIGVSGKTSQG